MIRARRSCRCRRRRGSLRPTWPSVIPKRLFASWWEATEAEQHALLDLAEQVKELLEDWYAPDGWNLGVNIGRAAGQTVDHLHLHLIPRYEGDVADPRGGIRHTIPARGNWQTLGAEPSAGYDTPGTGVRLFDGVQRPLGRQLTALLRDPGYDCLDVAVAFTLPSGVEVVAPALADGGACSASPDADRSGQHPALPRARRRHLGGSRRARER